MNTKEEREDKEQEGSQQGADRQPTYRQGAGFAFRDAEFNQDRRDLEDGGRQDNTRHAVGQPMGAGPSMHPQSKGQGVMKQPGKRSKSRRQTREKVYSPEPKHIGRQSIYKEATQSSSENIVSENTVTQEEPRHVPKTTQGEDISSKSQEVVMSFRDGKLIVRDDIDQYFLIGSNPDPTTEEKEIFKKLSSDLVFSLCDAVENGSLRPEEMSFEQARRHFDTSDIRMD